jgi:hypothetical protein
MRLRLLLLGFVLLATVATSSAADPPPATVTVSKGPPPVAAAPTATFEFSSQPPADSYTCTLDTGTADCTSPKDYSDLADGDHTFVVHATKNGSTVDSDPYKWKIDSAPPSITAHPAAATNDTSADFSFSGPEDGFTFECALDDASLAACISPQHFAGLAERPHTFRVVAVDAANGVGKAAEYDWVVDLTPPQTTITAMPPSPAGTSARFEFSSNESGVTFKCALDGVEAACASPATYDGLAGGVHSFQVQATDAATNQGPPASYSWVVDATPPDLRLSEAPPALTRSDTATFAFASGEPGAGFRCALDDAPFEQCESPMVYERLADGSHTFSVEAVDPVANLGGPLVYAWTVDTTPPANVSRLRARVGYRRAAILWKRSASRDFDHLTLFAAAGKTLTPVYTGATTRYARSSVEHLRTYRYRIVSYDRAGNASAAESVAITPSALLHAPRPGAVVGASPSFAWERVPGARFYNVQLFRGGTKILTTWPRAPRLLLARRWSFGGRTWTLSHGRYRWYVWPAFGTRTRPRYGRPLGASSFVVR